MRPIRFSLPSPRHALFRVGGALVALLALLSVDTMIAPPAAACETYVSGYYRSDGRYVQGHYRTCANDSVWDNWSTRGNYNPYTGQPGTRSYDPYYTPWYSPSYPSRSYCAYSWSC